MTPLDNVRILEFPGVNQPTRGTLTVLENIHYDSTLPSGEIADLTFPIHRVFYIYNVPSGGKRGGHAHHTNQEILICLSGGLDITLTDGINSRDFHLDNPSRGLLIPTDVWNWMSNFLPGTILLALCSEEYDTDGYIHDFEEFAGYIRNTYHA